MTNKPHRTFAGRLAPDRVTYVKVTAQNFKKGINNKANTNGGTDGQTWRRLKRIANAVFENLLA